MTTYSVEDRKINDGTRAEEAIKGMDGKRLICNNLREEDYVSQ